MLKTVVTLFALILLVPNAGGQEVSEETKAGPPKILTQKILYDGPQESTPAPFYFKERQHYYVGWRPESRSCGTITISRGSRQNELPEASKYSCKQTIVGIDFKQGGYLTFIDLVKDWKADENGKRVTFPVARYLALVTANPTIYTEALSTLIPTNNKKLDTLAAVMERLANANQVIGQERYIDGDFSIASVGPMKFDPENYKLVWPDGENDRGISFTTATQYYTVRAQADDVDKYPKPTELFKAISQTLEILEQGREELLLNSDEKKFKALLIDNATTIAAEFKEAIRLMKVNRYHVNEMGWFIGELSRLIAAIDNIIQSKTGTEPGLMQLLRTK